MNPTCFAKKLTESLTRPLAACTLALAITAPVHAALLAYDPIDGYDTGNSLAGQAAGGSGFTGVWQTNNVHGNGFTDVVSGGLTYGNLEVSGSQHISQIDVNGYLRTELTTPINTGTVYMSVLARAASNADGTFVWGPVVTVNLENVDAAVTVPRDDQVHLIIMKFDLGSAGTGDDSVTLYLDPTLGIGENSDIQTVDLSVDNEWINGTGGTLLYLVGRGGNGLEWDELRVGTTWEDVTPVIPEPSSLALIGLGGLCTLRRRRNV